MSDTLVISQRDLVDVIVTGLQRIPAYDRAVPGNRRAILTEWTSSVRSSLKLAGEERDEEVYCERGRPKQGEFLLDMIWQNPETLNVDVGIECEWGDCGNVAYDFEKLLLIKAQLKVMICDPETQTGRKLNPFPEILERTRRYSGHLAGEKYLVINVNGGPKGGRARAYVWDVPSSGPQPNADFSELPGSPFRYKFS